MIFDIRDYLTCTLEYMVKLLILLISYGSNPKLFFFPITYQWITQPLRYLREISYVFNLFVSWF